MAEEHASAEGHHEEAPPPAITEDGRVHAQAPDGSFVTLPLENADKAVQHGYRIEGRDEFAARQYAKEAGLSGAARTFLENAASTATLGGYDVLGGAIGGDEFRRTRALGELALPTVATAGKITGMVVPALIPGGAEAEAANIGAHGAQAAELAAEAAEGGSLLSRAAGAVGTVARNTPGGLALRGGEAASELVGHGLGAIGLGGDLGLIGNAARSGLRMAAGGAVEGAAFGAGGALSEAALAPGGDYDGLAQKLWAAGLHGAEFGATVGGGLGIGGELLAAGARKIGGSFSARRALQDLADAKTLKSAGLTESEVTQLAEQGGKEGVRDAAKAIREAPEIEWTDSAATRSRKVVDAADKAEEALGTMRKGLDEARAPGDGVDVRGVLDQWEQRAAELREQSISNAGDRLAAKVESEIRRFKESFPEGERASFEAAHDLRTTLDSELEHYRDAGNRLGGKADTFHSEMMRLRDDIEREFESSADRVMQERTSPEFRQQYDAARARHGALTEAAELLKSRAVGGGEDIGSQIAGAAGLAWMGPKGILLAAANKAIRSAQADHIVGKLASELAKFDQRVETATSRWASKSQRAAHGAETVAEAPPIPHGAHGAHSSLKHAIEHAGEVGKVTTSSTLHVRSEAAEQREHIEEYFRKLQGAQREASAPEGTLLHLPGAPETQKAAENVRRNTAAWLVDQAPVPPTQIKNPTMARLARQRPPNPSEVASWLRKARTIEDPNSALISFENGTLHPDQVDALEQMPAVLEAFRRAAIEQVTNSNKDISYESRMQLGVLLGVVTDPSLRPESIALSQETYQQIREQQQKAEKKSGPPAPSAPGKAPPGASSRTDELEEGVAI